MPQPETGVTLTPALSITSNHPRFIRSLPTLAFTPERVQSQWKARITEVYHEEVTLTTALNSSERSNKDTSEMETEMAINNEKRQNLY